MCNKTFDTYCPICDIEVSACLVERHEHAKVRGENIYYTATVAICPSCGEVIGDSRIESKNLDIAFDKYRKLHGYLTTTQIHSLRKAYGLSLRDFSRLLGFGEQTYARYERGSLPDETHNNTMKLACSPKIAPVLLQNNIDKTDGKVKQRLQKAVDTFVANYTSAQDIFKCDEWNQILFDECIDKPSNRNGYRTFDADRFIESVYVLAKNCKNFCITKLHKALFFADSITYEKTSVSITGLKYAHGWHGPMVDNRDHMYSIITSSGALSINENSDGWGSFVTCLEQPKHVLSDEEIQCLTNVSIFINTFKSASELSEYSHTLDAWSNTENGQIITFKKDSTEVTNAFNKRIKACCPF